MTILRAQDIAGIAGGLASYDAELQSILGCGLKELALKAVGRGGKSFEAKAFTKRVAIIPMTCGKGRITGFCETLQSIALHLGFSAFITRATDVSGIAEAFDSGADILLHADDERYIAIDLRSRRVVDNAESTGMGFACGLALMAGGVESRMVLVVGGGPVGRAASAALLKMGGGVALFDIDPVAAQTAASSLQSPHNMPVIVEENLGRAFQNYRLILDATPEAAFIDCDNICAETFIAAPGVPLGVTEAAALLLGRHLLHDPLQIGTATMLVDSALSAPAEGSEADGLFSTTGQRICVP
jgi:pyrrolysine biosynthesis protein PylD